MRYKAAIFDLDGTLIDSTWVWEKMIEDFCNVYSIEEKIRHVNLTAHMPPTEFINYIREEYGIKKGADEIMRDMLEKARSLYDEGVTLKKGAKRLLNLMKNKSIKIGLATSCFVDIADFIIKKLEIYDIFSSIEFSETLNTNKLSADIYLEVAKNLGVLKKECVVFEDIILPFEEVKKNGMGFFGVEDLRRDEEIKKQLAIKSDCYIKDFDEFIENGSFEKFFC